MSYVFFIPFNRTILFRFCLSPALASNDPNRMDGSLDDARTSTVLVGARYFTAYVQACADSIAHGPFFFH